MTMKPYLHFTPGDTLLFETWVPTSSGAIAGACIGLAVLAIIERWLNGVRGVLEMKWKKRYVAQTVNPATFLTVLMVAPW